MCRERVAQAAADEAALLAPPLPPPEPAAKSPSPSRTRRTAAPAQPPAKKTPKKTAAGSSPTRKSKAAKGSNEQKLVLPDNGPSQQPPAESQPLLTASAASASETVDDIPAQLSAALLVWQHFAEQAQPLILGRAQPDNMVQLMSSQVEGKQAEQVMLEVFAFSFCFFLLQLQMQTDHHCFLLLDTAMLVLCIPLASTQTLMAHACKACKLHMLMLYKHITHLYFALCISYFTLVPRSQVCGMSYKRGVQSSMLPAVPGDADRVPEPYLLQIVKKPKVRADRKPITRFTLLTPTFQVQPFFLFVNPGCSR